MATQTSTSSTPLALSKTARQSKGRLHKLGFTGLLAEFLKYLILIVLAASFILPFYWMASSALKDDNQIYTIPPIWIPSPALWQNFLNAWFSGHLNFNLYTYNTVVK